MTSTSSTGTAVYWVNIYLLLHSPREIASDVFKARNFQGAIRYTLKHNFILMICICKRVEISNVLSNFTIEVIKKALWIVDDFKNYIYVCIFTHTYAHILLHKELKSVLRFFSLSQKKGFTHDVQLGCFQESWLPAIILYFMVHSYSMFVWFIWTAPCNTKGCRGMEFLAHSWKLIKSY